MLTHYSNSIYTSVSLFFLLNAITFFRKSNHIFLKKAKLMKNNIPIMVTTTINSNRKCPVKTATDSTQMIMDNTRP